MIVFAQWSAAVRALAARDAVGIEQTTAVRPPAQRPVHDGSAKLAVAHPTFGRDVYELSVIEQPVEDDELLVMRGRMYIEDERLSVPVIT